MRKYLLILFFILFLSINIHANNGEDISIKQLVEKIKRADVKDRRQLINQLKLKLRKVNKENQKKMAMKLKSSLNQNNKNHRNRNNYNNRNKNHSLHRHMRYRHFRGHR